MRATVLADDGFDLARGLVRGNDHGDVAFDAGQVFQLAHAQPRGHESGEGVEVDLGEDDVLSADLELLQQAGV